MNCVYCITKSVCSAQKERFYCAAMNRTSCVMVSDEEREDSYIIHPDDDNQN